VERRGKTKGTNRSRKKAPEEERRDKGSKGEPNGRGGKVRGREKER